VSGRRTPYTSIVAGLPATVPFVGPEAIERRTGRGFTLRLGANESLFGVAPGVATAIAGELARVGWYGDPEAFDIRARLAALHDRRPVDSLVMGAGIDELLGVIVRLVTEPGDPVVTSAGAYPTFNYHVAGFGGRLVTVRYRDDREDLDALAETVHREGAKLVYVSNPDNPMGSWHEAAAIAAFVGNLPEAVLVILDEAYAEFAPPAALLPESFADPRVIRLRTFSKAQGLAGLRIGYAMADPAVIQGIGKIRNHFGVNRFAQAAAIAALDDPAFTRSVVAEVERGRADYAALARDCGCESLASATNFLTIDVGGAERAKAMLRALEAEGVFIRMPGVPPLDRCIRVTVGPAADRARFAEIFRAVSRRV
jgi:histidinol-phosphate aminotransferase